MTRDSIRESVETYDKSTDYLDSVKEIRKQIQLQHENDIKPWLLRDILRKDLRMRYKRIASGSWTGNSAKNIILR